MGATLKLTHKAIGVEVRRGTYDIVVDGQRAGSLEMNDTIEIPIEPGRHTLQSSQWPKLQPNSDLRSPPRAKPSPSDAPERVFLPIFLASFVVPSLALQLRRDSR